MEAATPGSWGNRLRVQLTPIEDVMPRANLRITLDPGPEGGAPTREILARVVWNGTLRATVEASSNLIRIEGPFGPLPGVLEYRLTGGADGVDGLTLTDYLGDPGEDEPDKWYGLRRLETEESVAIVSLPDAVYTRPDPAPPTVPIRIPAQSRSRSRLFHLLRPA